jgi:hypothetical protein
MYSSLSIAMKLKEDVGSGLEDEILTVMGLLSRMEKR